jgi:hypothetical protein
MDTNAYSLNDSYVSVGSRYGGVGDNIKELWAAHKMLMSCILVVLVLLVIYMLYQKMVKQGFMPTATLRFQKLDGLGFEHLDSTTPGTTTTIAADGTTTTTATDGTTTTTVPSAAAVSAAVATAAPDVVTENSTPSYANMTSAQVLAQFNCAPAGTNPNAAWQWMSGGSESMSSVKPSNDNDFSKIMAGQ